SGIFRPLSEVTARQQDSPGWGRKNFNMIVSSSMDSKARAKTEALAGQSGPTVTQLEDVSRGEA
ncbi:MAG: hypothetical protein WBP89_08635, partial [Sedimenticolaceae bacterium]